MPQIIPAVLGGIGIMQAGQAQRSQDNAMHEANKTGAPTREATRMLLQLAKAYNPHEEDKQAITAANQNASSTLKQQLGQLNGSFTAAGGSPTGDTAFNFSAANTANRVMDPLREFQAQLASTETQRKMAAFAPVMGAPVGAMANTYFQSAQMQNTDMGPALKTFADAFKKIGGAKGGATPAGGVLNGTGGDLYPDYGTQNNGIIWN